MADDRDPFYAPNHVIPPRRAPPPGQRVWTLTKDGRRVDCELRGHGEFGWETQTLRDGELSTGRMFPLYLLALRWASLEYEAFQRDGWTGDPMCRCREGWVCEAHPANGWPHPDPDDPTRECAGPGEACSAPACPWPHDPPPLPADWHSFKRRD